MYIVKVVRGNTRTGEVQQRVFPPCPNYTVTLRPPGCAAVREGTEPAGVDVEFWPDGSSAQVIVNLPNDGDSIYITSDQPLRNTATGELMRDQRGRMVGVGRTVDAFHWPPVQGVIRSTNPAAESVPTQATNV